MAGVTTYSCTKCRPVDTEIIEAYLVLTNTSKAVSQQEAGRVAAENARVLAEQGRAQQFAEDHGVAQEDHRIASGDHTLAVADHGTASDDHVLAVADHGTASDDHTASTSATTRANNAAAAAEHMVDIHQGPPGPAGKAPVVGANGNWWTWDDETEAYVDSGEQAQGPVGATPDISIGTVTTGDPGDPAAASMGGTAAAPILNLTIPKGQKGDQGNTGSSVAYPFELVNNETTDDATKAHTAQGAKRLKDEISQLEAEVHNLSGKYYGVFEDSLSLPEGDAPGYAFVGTESPFAIYNFDGEEWADSGATVDGIQGEPGVGFASVDSPTPADGTTKITLSNGDTITIDLNHDHGQYTKVVMCADIAEYNAITTKDAMTFYIIPEIAMYLGDTLIMSQSSPLPYTPLSYIQTDGTAYIDTGINGNTPRSAKLKITPKQATSFCYHLGCRASTIRCGLLSQWGAPNESYDNSLTYSYNTADWNGAVINIASSITNGTPLETKTSFKGGAQVLSVKQSGGNWANTSNNQIASSISTNLNMFIGACNNDGTANRNVPSGTRYHYVKIYSDDNYTTLIFDGVPCLYNGEYGLWDRVTNAFFGNAAGSGSFTGA